VTLSVDSESAMTCYWPNDLPVIQSVSMEAEGAKGHRAVEGVRASMTRADGASCSPGEVEEKVQSPM